MSALIQTCNYNNLHRLIAINAMHIARCRQNDIQWILWHRCTSAYMLLLKHLD